MNKKEISEIKKRFTKTKCSFTRLCGCYVDADKEKRLTLKEAFLGLPEEEMLSTSTSSVKHYPAPLEEL